MAEAFDAAGLPTDKAARYKVVAEEIASVLAGEADPIARLATVAAMLAEAFDHFLWTGFYLVDQARPGELVVGPYQGRLGCLRIALGRGVCGAAAAEQRTIVVPDVEAFAGHIACDSRSRSEIVAPLVTKTGALAGVLDVDSAAPAAFDDVDAEGLARIIREVLGFC